jgi:hypothetical protein
MSKRVISCIPTAAVGLFATAILLGTNYPARAAGDCLAEPNRPAQGGHWYYRFDHANNRKCWYLVGPGAPTPVAAAPEPQQPPEPAPQPTFGSFFSSLTAGFPGPSSGPQPDAGDPHGAQAARPDNLKNNEPESGRQPGMALASKQHRPAHLRPPPVEHADEHPAQPVNQAERDALFQEFLRWKDRQ